MRKGESFTLKRGQHCEDDVHACVLFLVRAEVVVVRCSTVSCAAVLRTSNPANTRSHLTTHSSVSLLSLSYHDPFPPTHMPSPVPYHSAEVYPAAVRPAQGPAPPGQAELHGRPGGAARAPRAETPSHQSPRCPRDPDRVQCVPRGRACCATGWCDADAAGGSRQTCPAYAGASSGCKLPCND